MSDRATAEAQSSCNYSRVQHSISGEKKPPKKTKNTAYKYLSRKYKTKTWMKSYLVP